LILLRLFEDTAGDETSSTGRVVTGNHEVSCSQHSRPMGLPLNPMECEKAYVQDYLRRYGARKVEANAMVIRPDESRALLRQTILRYVPEDAPLVYQGRLRRAQDEARREVRREMQDRS
jgi:hypothetical protein